MQSIPNVVGKIALVDDDSGMRRTVNDLLRSLGYAVAIFASAEEYLDWARANQPLCIITDIKMPGISGVELQRRLLAQGNRTPVIFVTAFPENGIRDRVLDAGAFGFLVKPFPQHALLECLVRALAA